MLTYILLSTLTPEGHQTLSNNPDRLEEVNQEISDFGCIVLAQYAVLGPYDFITVIEAEDNETVAHLTMGLSSRGTVNIMALPTVSRSDLQTRLKGPRQIGRS